ncbi:TNT domain-containing protein [Streptomyces sp. NBC_01476]|uniref:TNT domain-containing protein n=1 Tax=Streptomyces sp. NBC_01476 TaxID=2903881 RepID=UPI002E2F7466|nr:TNT domain-containing protein [Streptomyces sp. NBC_01476]
MRVLRHFVWSAIASLLLVGFAPATVHAEDGQARPAVQCPTEGRSRGTNTAPNPALEQYLLDDWRLGPEELPTTGPMGDMLRGYRPADHTSPYWILGCYWQTNPQTGVSGWWYPDNNGFALDKQGRPVEKPVTLRVGQLVDLFGSGRGNFLAPAGTPYAKRAIPPSNLDEYTTDYPSSYHLYRVVAPLDVEAGPIRPWFGQPGLGLQYMTANTIPDLITAHKLLALN